MKKLIITLALLCPVLASAKIMVNGTVKIGGNEASRNITLQEDQTRFHYWTSNGLLLIGQILQITPDGVKLQLALGRKANNSNPEDPMVRFDRVISKKEVSPKWGEDSTLEVRRGDADDLTISVKLVQVD